MAGKGFAPLSMERQDLPKEQEQYAAAALFTLALHMTQVWTGSCAGLE